MGKECACVQWLRLFLLAPGVAAAASCPLEFGVRWANFQP